jgi:SAM-dependent methyltransferase
MTEPGLPFAPDLKKWFSSDELFHLLYPFAIRELAQKHWTPLTIARKAAEFLAADNNVRVLDIGSGAGKFCLGASFYKPGSFYYGIEQRKNLVDHAEVARKILNLPNVSFLHGNFTALDFKSYDHFYFYNSFYENLAFTDKIDQSIAYSVERYNYYTGFLKKLLEQTRSGTKLVTFNSLGNEVPAGFKLLDAEPDTLLRFWIKK